MSNIIEKFEELASLIKKREPEIDNLRLGLSKAEIQQKTACLPFNFPKELYQLYQWYNGIERDNADESPFLFRDRYLFNLNDAIETYFDIQSTFDIEDKKIAD